MVCILRTIPPKLIHMPTQSGVILPAFLCTIHWISSLALSNELRVYCTSTNNYFWLLHRSIFLLPSLGYLTSGIGRNSESSLVSHPNTHSLSLPIVLSLSRPLPLFFYLPYVQHGIYLRSYHSIYLLVSKWYCQKWSSRAEYSKRANNDKPYKIPRIECCTELWMLLIEISLLAWAPHWMEV